MIKVFFRLIQLVFPLAGWMILAITMGVIGFMCAIGIPVVGTLGILGVLDYHLVVKILVVCAIGRGILRYAEQACNHYIAFKLLARLRDQVFMALRKLAPAKLEGRNKGDLISLITSDIELLEVFYAHTISPICIAILVSLICICIQPNMVLRIWALLSYCVVGILLPILVSKRSKQIGIEYRKKAGTLNSYVLESMRGLKESLQYDDTENRLHGLNACTNDLVISEKQLKHLQAKTVSWTNACIIGLSLGMYLIGKQFGISNDILIYSVVLQISSFGPVVALANLGTGLAQTMGAAKRVLDLLDEVPMVKEVINGKDVQVQDVQVDHIDFAYEDETILKDFSLKIKDHSILGIQGKSGSGKSTLLKLLMRFWDVNQGRILMDQENIKDINTSSLRNNEGYMCQETVLFHDTIENNLRIAKQDATAQEIVEACKKANIHDFIMSLPQRYQSQVGELGSTLSGGERQRIGLARMFLHDADFVLLDEPTSNLDSLNEGSILKSIYKEKENKTIIFVSHKESTLQHCDKVIHMESERVS